MAKIKSRWLRDFLIIPLVVGLTIALFTFVLPKIFEKEKEISYTIDDFPSYYLSPESVGNLEIKINDVVTNSLLAYEVEFWNSGDIPLKELPVRYVFGWSSINFKVLTVIHKTEPKYEFGEIREEGSDTHSKRFVYSLLNPGERVTVTFLCTGLGPTKVSFYTKLEGLSVKQVTMKPLEYIALVVTLIGVIAAFIAQLLSGLLVKWRKVRIGQWRETLSQWLKKDYTDK